MTLADAKLFRPLGEPVPEDDPYGIVDGKATYWVTRDRRRVAIAEMTDAHLINTVNMLERGIERRREAMNDAWNFAGSCQGEMASYYAGHMADDMASDYDAFVERMRPILAGMRGEIESRGLVEVLVPLTDGARPSKWLRLPVRHG